MKKLMTMLAAAAMAFGLYAGGTGDEGFIAGTAFEANDGGNSYNTTDGFATGYWAGTGDGITTVAEVPHGLNDNRPAKFDGAADVHTLAIKTTLGNPVTHYIATDKEGQGIGDGLYFDGLVNMTVFDKDDTIPDADLDGAKLGVYLQLVGEDDSDGTNFVVVAKANAKVADGHYVCSLGAAKISAGWHRLTIKAIGHIDAADTGDTGFVVFVDGKAVECEDAKIADVSGLKLAAADWNENGNLFVSRVKNDATIASVAFDGQGSVDELVFTTTAPSFAMDMNIATVAFDAAKATGVQYSMDAGATWTPAVGNPFKVAAARGQELPAKIKVKWTGINGYMDNPGVDVDVTAGAAAKIPDSAYTQAAAAIISADGTTTNLFAALTGDNGAIAEANKAAADCTLQLLAAAGAIAIQNNNAITITVDLNGQQVAESLMSQLPGATVVVTDTSDDKDGKVDGTVGGPKFSINAGWYKVNPSSYLAAGKKAVLDKADNYYKIKDKVPVTAVEINKEALELAVDGTETLTYTVTPDGADVDTAVWSSDNTAVATVDPASGLVTAIAAGTATITITVNGTSTDTCVVTVKASEITITATLGEGIDSATIDGKPVASGEAIKLAAGTESVPVVLTANSGIKIPVFYCQKGVTSPVKKDASFTLDIEDGDTYYFTAKDAKDVDPTDAKDALEAKGVEPATTAKFPGESVKNLATWMEAKGMTDATGIEAINGSDYVQASVALDVALITEQTAVAVESQTFAATGSALTFKVEIADVEITSDNIADFVKTTNDVANWDKDGTGITVSAVDGVVTVDGGSNTAVFSKIVIPVDKTPN